MTASESNGAKSLHTGEELLPLVYDALKRVAAARLNGEEKNVTLQPTALVHEAWLRVRKEGAGKRWQDESHFFRAAAEAMRRILVEKARRRLTQKRGGDIQFVGLEEVEENTFRLPYRVLEVDEVLDRFAGVDRDAAAVVKMRYFVGMTVSETARALRVSERTVRRKWEYGKAWLAQELTE